MDFEVSGTVRYSMNERSKLLRKPIHIRMWTFEMIMFLLYTFYAAFPLLMIFTQHGPGLSVLAIFPGIIVKLLETVWKVSVPIRYMAFPPTVPEREHFIYVDEWGVRRPKAFSRTNGLVIFDIFAGAEFVGLIAFWIAQIKHV